MSYLFEHMLHRCLSSIDDFVANNDVSFVTFNYDRTLEYFFATRFANTYRVDIAKAWEAAKRIPIVHVYGSVGEFSPSLHHRPIPSSAPGPFEPPRAPGSGPFTPMEIRQAAESIRLMYEDRNNQSGIAEAKELIKAAQCVCFLGFGFDPDNIDRLELGNCCTPPPTGILDPGGSPRHFYANASDLKWLSDLYRPKV
jgi:hypothetical protein